MALGRQLGSHGARRPDDQCRVGATGRSQDQPGRIRRHRVPLGPGDRGAHHHAAGGVDGAQSRLAVVRAAASVHPRLERGPHASSSADRSHAALLRGGGGTHRSTGRDRGAGAHRSCHHDPLDMGHRVSALQSGSVDSLRSLPHGRHGNARPFGGRRCGPDRGLPARVGGRHRGRGLCDHGRGVQRGRLRPLACRPGRGPAAAAQCRDIRAPVDLAVTAQVLRSAARLRRSSRCWCSP